MGLFGALFAGVAGLNSQSSKISSISNNISNVNTVGYKQSEETFDALVVDSGTSGSYSPGGVLGQTQNLVTQQGTIEGTSSSTDVAISGNGFFVVNSQSDGTGQTLLSREGSFTQDALGNFVNADGDYLQALKLVNGVVPSGESTSNISSLQTVNVSSSAAGAAVPTTQVTLAANLDAAQATLKGAGITLTPSTSDSANTGIGGGTIIVGDDYSVDGYDGGVTGESGIARGDSFEAQTSVDGQALAPDTFVYGGFAIGRSVSAAGTASEGDGQNALLTANAGDGEALSGATAVVGTTGQVTISVANIADFVVNSGPGTTTTNVGSVYLSNVTGSVSDIPASDLEGSLKVLSVNVTAGTVTVQSLATTSSAANTTMSADITNRTSNFTGNVLDATSNTANFLTNPTAFSSTALSFTITNSETGTTSTFTYSASPNTTQGQFDSMTTLAQAISNTTGLTATVSSGRLYVGATDANAGLTFANVNDAGDATGAGINWVQELDLQDYSAITGTNRFNSLSSLAAAVNSTSDLTATVANVTGAASLSINASNPLANITFSDIAATGAASTGSFLEKFGVNGATITSTNPTGLTAASTGSGAMTTGSFSPTYSFGSMASGAVTPQFTRDITVYDALGQSHTLAFNVTKIGTGQWAAEITAIPATDVTATSVSGTTVPGLVAYGVLNFNGSGEFTGVTGDGAIQATLQNNVAFSVNWAPADGTNPSSIAFDLGTQNTTSGLSQFSSNFDVTQANQNGTAVGQLTGVSITAQGFVEATYSNGQTENLYQIPLAVVSNPDGLAPVSGNAFETTEASGIANLANPGQNGAGSLSTSSLEQSNVDLSQQLTNLIVAQQAYDANTKVLSIAGTLLQNLNQIIQ